MVSTYHRPDSGTIHCGFGFSCQVPTHPTGWTLTRTLAGEAPRMSFHCGAAPPMLCWRNAVNGQRIWRLIPCRST